MPLDYSKASIYKLCCNDVSINEIYVGSTLNFRLRKNKHKSACNNEKNKDNSYAVYIFIRTNGGFGNWSMVEIEQYNAKDKRDLHTRERYWIETFGAILNSNIPSRTDTEYRADNKSEIAIQKAKYYADNKAEIAIQTAKYRADNKAEIAIQKAKYRADNKAKIAIQKAKYRADKKTKIAIKDNLPLL